jgi:predicted methyltransferase
MPDDDWWQALWPDPAKVLVEMGVQPGMVVVDLCCGDGLFTAVAATGCLQLRSLASRIASTPSI